MVRGISKYGWLGIICMLCIFVLTNTFPAFSQKNKTYLSLGEALMKPDKVYKLVIIGFENDSIPSSIGKLKKLKSLRIEGAFNKLPLAIQELESLEELIISKTAIREIPPFISILHNLKTFKCTNNLISRLPDNFGDLSSLTKVDLQFNYIDSLPASFAKLHKLKHLNLADNQLCVLPNNVGDLTNLSQLNISNNQLATLPWSIGLLKSLVVLSAWGNKLYELPESFCSLSSLNECYLARNQLIHLPDSIGILKLNRFDISLNKLTSLPSSFGTMGVRFLNLHSNNIGALPNSFVNLPMIKSIRMSNNQLSSLPQGISIMESLEFFDLSGNFIKKEDQISFQKLLPSCEFVFDE